MAHEESAAPWSRLSSALGDRVAVHYGSSGRAAEELVASLAGSGHVSVQADLRSADDVRRAVDSAAEQLGGLDVLVNNAGIFVSHPPTSTTYEDWQAVWADTLGINLVGAANATFCAIPHLIAAGGGAIVNVSSRGAFRGEPKTPAYGASKAGLNAFGQSMARELAPHAISVGTVAPGYVETDMARAVLDGPSGDDVCGRSLPSGGWRAPTRSRPRSSGWPRLRRGSPAARSSTSTEPRTCAADRRPAGEQDHEPSAPPEYRRSMTSTPGDPLPDGETRSKTRPSTPPNPSRPPRWSTTPWSLRSPSR